MKLSERQIKIMNKVLHSDQGIDIKALAVSEGVTLQTIYNDLKKIENLRFITNKGFVHYESGNGKNSIFSKKVYDNRAIRENSCHYIINEILNGEPKGVIFIDGGSTGYVFYNCLKSRDIHDLTIITNNPMIIGGVTDAQDFFFNNNVFSLAGRLDPVRLSLYSISRKNGVFPIDSDNYTIDYFIVGFRSISPDGQVYISNEEEVYQKKFLISKSRNLIFIVTPDKFSGSGLFEISSLKQEINQNNKGVHVVFSLDKKSDLDKSKDFMKFENVIGESRLNLLK